LNAKTLDSLENSDSFRS